MEELSNNLSSAESELLAKLGITSTMIEQEKKRLSLITERAKSAKRSSVSHVGTAPEPYVLCLAYKCKLCKTITHKYYNMIKSGSGPYLKSDEIRGETPPVVHRRECYNVESCLDCREFLQTLTHEELVNKVLYYAYAYRERMDIKMNPCKVCDSEARDIKEQTKRELLTNALEKSLSESILDLDELEGS